MGLPKVNITLGNGSIGAVTRNDGVAGIIVSGAAVSGQFALGDVLGPFLSVDDAKAKGITPGYDTANVCVAYQHIKEFFDEAGDGNKLYVMIVNRNVPISTLASVEENFAKKMLTEAGGAICLLGICRTVSQNESYDPTYLNQFDTDIYNAATNAQQLYDEEYSQGRPVQIFLEGYDFQGNAGSARDLRDASGLNCNRVSIVIHQDYSYAAPRDFAAKYASVGSALGRAAKVHVGRNIGRVQDGAIAITDVGLSNGEKLGTFNASSLDTLNDSGYIFAIKYVGKGGFYFNGDPVCAPLTDDYNSVARGRAIDKVVRITNLVYTNYLNDDVELDTATGRLNAAVAKSLQDAVESEIQTQMLSGVKEISGAKAIIDLTQNILVNNKTTIALKVVPKGLLQSIDVNLSYAQSI